MIGIAAFVFNFAGAVLHLVLAFFSLLACVTLGAGLFVPGRQGS